MRKRIAMAFIAIMAVMATAFGAPSTASGSTPDTAVSAKVSAAKKSVTFTCHDGRTYTNNGIYWSFGGGKFGVRFGSNGGRNAILVFNLDGSSASTKFIIKDFRPGGLVVQSEGTGTQHCQVMGGDSQGYEIIAKRNGNTWRF